MWEVIQSGGPLMVPLAACAILAIGYSIERVWVFSQLPSHGEAQESLERLEHALRDGGTAQVVRQATWTRNDELDPEKRDHAGFASYAPADRPELVVVVFVEHGGGGSKVAAPLARTLYETHFASRTGPGTAG